MESILPYLATVGWSAVGVVVVAWLIVSFTKPGPRRAIFEWLGALGLYVALLALFLNLLGRSVASDSWVGIIAFGFLATMFSLGALLSVAQLVISLRGPGTTVTSATN